MSEALFMNGNQTRTRHLWNGKPLATISFQSHLLPPFAITLDVAAKKLFAESDEESSRWFWHFTICVDAIRRLSSLKPPLFPVSIAPYESVTRTTKRHRDFAESQAAAH
jgi:hypothetical protein